MKWVGRVWAEGEELYYFVVKYKDSDKNWVKFYYLARDMGVHQMTGDLWSQIVNALETEDIILSWERREGSMCLDVNGFTYLE